MSRIRRLSIRGIRNFGEDEDAIFRFFRPITLILGPNGTGKTTVIEALKFATCGEFPPNSDRGKFFIHDPALTKTCSVRGVVKAEIIDSSGNVYTICRTIESSKTHTSMRFKTLDSALSRKNKNTQEVVSITNKCASVDTELTLAMGVSVPILQNVIFCHQEDLNWPFQDGKKLKEKFDEIFDTIKFNKALEKILKLSREMKQQIDLMKEQKKSCLHIVGEVNEKETKLEDHKKRLEIFTKTIYDINKELRPMNQKIQDMETIDSEYKNLVLEEKKKKAEYDVFMQQLNDLKKNIQTIFKGTMEELLEQIESYDKKLMENALEIDELEDRLKEIAKEESKISNTLAGERITEGALRQQIKDKNTKVKHRNSILNEILSIWNMHTVDSNVSEIEVTALLERLERKTQELEHITEENRSKQEEQEKKLQKEVDHLRSEYSKLESEKNVKENEVIEVREENDKIKSQIIKLDAMGSKINSITSRMQEMETKMQQLNDEMDVDEAKKDVLAKIQLRNETEALLNAVDKEIALLLKQSSLQAELELQKSTLIAKQKEMQVLKEKHEEKLKKLLDLKELPHMKLRNNFDIAQKELVSQIDAITREIQKEERQFATLETTLSHVQREIETKKTEMNSIKAKISVFCDYQDFDETLLLQSRKVKDLQDRRGIYAHQSVAYKEYMKQLRDTNPCCPLCHRGFNETETVVNLLRKMEMDVKDHPNRLKECEAELKLHQDKYNKMLELKPLVEKVVQFEEFELEKLTDNLEKCKNRLIKSQTTITELKEKKLDPENKLAMCRDITGDVMLWDRYIDEILNIKQQIDDFQIRITNAGITTKRNIEEAQAHREELKATLKNISNAVESLQTQINTHNEKIHEAREKYNSLREEQLRMRSETQKLKQLKDKQEELYSKEISLGKLVDELQQKVAIAESELSKGMRILEKVKKENKGKQENDRKLVAERNRRVSDLHKVQDEIDAFIQRKIPDALMRSESRIQNCEDMLNNLLKEKNCIEVSVSKQKHDIANHDVQKRELSDNVTLRKTEESIKSMKEEWANIKQKMNRINYDQLVQEWQDLQTRKESLLRQQSIANGNKQELERIIKECTQELQKDIYRQARKNLRHKCIELKVMEKAASDLKEYSRALDISMMECHRERMVKVNRIIKKLWKMVYTGRDTTSIEIRADATEGVGNTRRTYNYKLVQTKHGHEMDMRGRCSAGQKVLASIIIRLALAETFCKDCGILALDEPTTNLDQENTDSLADALAKVVKLRSQHQKNFQLIVISHDEKFLLKLAELSPNKGFFELYRKNNGYTTIRQVQNRDYFTTEEIKEEISSEEEDDNQSGSSRDRQMKTVLQDKSKEDNSRSRKRHDRSPDIEQGVGKASKKRYIFA